MFNSIVNLKKHKATYSCGDGVNLILQLKERYVFPLFHKSRFLGQGGANDKCFLFKISTKGLGSIVDLANCTCQTIKGDFCKAWVNAFF